ncbi:hypothetical protein WA026_016408 [Henosepilachna vigintioctopunctata]|uniref:GATA zinc finger domain-containing protein 14-like n=1 Tax=Henosepilachna vigintioctopunctata TaxID=420089 RepID=A0AAW1UL83_9CUCU
MWNTMDKSTRSSLKFNPEPPQKNHEVLQRKEIFVREEEKSFQKCSTFEKDEHYSDRKQHFNNYGMKNGPSQKLTNETVRELAAKDRNYQNRSTGKTRHSNHYEWNRDNNCNTNFNKRASNVNSEGRKAERTFNFGSKKKNSGQQPLISNKNLNKNGKYNMENECNFKKNLSTDELGIHVKSESHLEDSHITTPGISDHVPVRSPNSSNLNPNALSFHQNCEFNTIDNAKDIINSSELETLIDTHEMRKNLPPTNIDTQIEAGAIKKTANVSSKIRRDKKKRVKDDLPSTASHYKHYDKVETQQRSIRENEKGIAVVLLAVVHL